MTEKRHWQERLTFTMEGLIIGYGWHGVEKQGDIFYRWSGPDNVSEIHMYPGRDKDNRINMTIYASADEETLVNLYLEADGIPLQTTLSQARHPAYVTAVLPAAPYKNPGEKTVLSFRVPQTIPLPNDSNQARSARSAGIALQQIDIFPLSRGAFIAKKFNDPTPFDGLKYMELNPQVKEGVIEGLYSSAYEYFRKTKQQNVNNHIDLYDKFDERPGDIFDILNQNMKEYCNLLEEKYLQEIALLKEALFQQDSVIHDLKDQLKTIK